MHECETRDQQRCPTCLRSVDWVRSEYKALIIATWGENEVIRIFRQTDLIMLPSPRGFVLDDLGEEIMALAALNGEAFAEAARIYVERLFRKEV